MAPFGNRMESRNPQAMAIAFYIISAKYMRLKRYYWARSYWNYF